MLDETAGRLLQTVFEVIGYLPIECLRHEHVLRVKRPVDGESALRIEEAVPAFAPQLRQTHCSRCAITANTKLLPLAKLLRWHCEHLPGGAMRLGGDADRHAAHTRVLQEGCQYLLGLLETPCWVDDGQAMDVTRPG